MAVVLQVESRFTRVMYLPYRVLLQGADGRFKPIPGPDMGYALRRPRRA